MENKMIIYGKNAGKNAPRPVTRHMIIYGLLKAAKLGASPGQAVGAGKFFRLAGLGKLAGFYNLCAARNAGRMVNWEIPAFCGL